MILFCLSMLIIVASATSPMQPSPTDPECPKRCRPTCEVPNPINCELNSECTYCGSGKVWDDNKLECVSIHKCPYDGGCNGDMNAIIKESPPPCPSTCDAPNELPYKKMSLAVGCVCKPGFILSEYDGKCIGPHQCPGGDPCGENEMFMSCRPNCDHIFYCPEEDPLEQPACFFNLDTCLSGCICQFTHRFKSKDNQTCVPAEECPPLKCTRENEEWNPCNQRRSTCRHATKPLTFFDFIFNTRALCWPECTCYDGYSKDENGSCIPHNECPK